MKRFKDESELAAVVEQHLINHNWEVYKEVVLSDGCRADIVAVRDKKVWIIETKNTASVAVFQQAYERLRFAHYVSVATPVANDNKVLSLFCTYYGVGWLQFLPYVPYGHHDQCIVKYEPKLYRRRELKLLDYTMKTLKRLHPEQKESIAGTQGGHFTPYRDTINKVAAYLRQHGPSTMKDIIKNISHHYASDAGARSCLAKNLLWFHKDQFMQIRNEKGILWELKE